jgi:hypothetical protein
MAKEQKQNSPWLTCGTGLAFGVVLGGSLTLAFAPALPVAVGVIATTTIIWGVIGYLAEEYQKNNLENGSNISSPSSSRRSSEKEEEEEVHSSFGTPTSPKSVLETGLGFRSQRDEKEIHHGSSPIARRVLFKSPPPNSREDSVNFVVITPFGGSNWDKTIFNTPPNSSQASPLPMTRKRRSASPSPSETRSRSPIYFSGHPNLTADLVFVPALDLGSLATNSTRPGYCIDTPGRDGVSQARIKAINVIEGRRKVDREDRFSKMKLAAEKGGNPRFVITEWQRMAESDSKSVTKTLNS